MITAKEAAALPSYVITKIFEEIEVEIREARGRGEYECWHRLGSEEQTFVPDIVNSLRKLGYRVLDVSEPEWLNNTTLKLEFLPTPEG